jgi:hypothetical protein
MILPSLGCKNWSETSIIKYRDIKAAVSSLLSGPALSVRKQEHTVAYYQAVTKLVVIDHASLSNFPKITFF